MSFIKRKKESDPDSWGSSWVESEEERSQSMWSREVIKKLLKKAGLC